MKIRLGFVSNSSSSSFVLFGAKFEVEDIKELCKKINIQYKEEDGETGIPSYNLIDKIDKKLEKMGLNILKDDGPYIIGKCYEDTEYQLNGSYEFTANDLKEMNKVMKKKLGIKNSKLIIGSRSC